MEENLAPTGMYKNLGPGRLNHLSTLAGFLPSTHNIGAIARRSCRELHQHIAPWWFLNGRWVLLGLWDCRRGVDRMNDHGSISDPCHSWSNQHDNENSTLTKSWWTIFILQDALFLASILKGKPQYQVTPVRWSPRHSLAFVVLKRQALWQMCNSGSLGSAYVCRSSSCKTLQLIRDREHWDHRVIRVIIEHTSPVVLNPLQPLLLLVEIWLTTWI